MTHLPPSSSPPSSLTYCSIDPGISNLGFCCVTVAPFAEPITPATWWSRTTILDATRYSPNFTGDPTAFREWCAAHLDPWLARADIVLIEQQQHTNPAAYALEFILWGYIGAKFPRARLERISPIKVKRRLECPTGLSHPQRKKWSMDFFRALGFSVPEGHKMDDVCDALLHVYFAEVIKRQPARTRRPRRLLRTVAPQDDQKLNNDTSDEEE